jgi:hypothetical protein
MSEESRKYGKSWAGMANCVMACLNGERSVFCTPKGNVAFIMDADLTALRDENEKLKEQLRLANVDCFNTEAELSQHNAMNDAIIARCDALVKENNRLRAEKRELVEAIGGVMHLFKHVHFINEDQRKVAILKSAVAKHREAK